MEQNSIISFQGTTYGEQKILGKTTFSLVPWKELINS